MQLRHYRIPDTVPSKHIEHIQVKHSFFVYIIYLGSLNKLHEIT